MRMKVEERRLESSLKKRETSERLGECIAHQVYSRLLQLLQLMFQDVFRAAVQKGLKR